MMNLFSQAKLKIPTVILVVLHCTALQAYVTSNNHNEGNFVSVKNIEKESRIKLSWLNHITMKITWPNNVSDLIYLKEVNYFEGKYLPR